MSRRKMAILALVLLVPGLFWMLREPTQNRLTFKNRSGQAITVLRITIGGQTETFNNVMDGAMVTSEFKILGDDHFKLNGQLADGTILSGRFGYVTNGMSGVRTEFVILPEGRIEMAPGNRAEF